ncbi:tumor necrosis factor receptor superfamily member 17 [Discoglossus pictus]
MAVHCLPSQYYDFLLQSCKSCHLRCVKTPPLPCQSYCTSNAAGAVTLPSKDNNWILWIILAFFLALIPTVFLLTVILRKQLKSMLRHRGNNQMDSSTETSNGDKDIKDAPESITIDTTHCLHCHGGDAAGLLDKDCDCAALSDYLFPLPAVEEGAAVLVTTKTSACPEPGPGVRGDAFREMKEEEFGENIIY